MTASLVCTSAVHDAMVADDATWSRWPLLGTMRWPALADEPAGAIEQRNCPHCGSTRSREVTP